MRDETQDQTSHILQNVKNTIKSKVYYHCPPWCTDSIDALSVYHTNIKSIHKYKTFLTHHHLLEHLWRRRTDPVQIKPKDIPAWPGHYHTLILNKITLLTVSLYHYKAKHPHSFESSLQQIHISQKQLNVSTQIC